MAASRYINPFTDFGFKKLFGEEMNKEILIAFLNALLPQEGNIVSINYLKNERLPATEFERKAVFDLYCENERGEKFIVEMQKAKQRYFKERSLYYATFPIQEQSIPGGEWDFNLKAVYMVAILDFTFDDEADKERYIREIKLMDTQTNTLFYDKLTFLFLEMPRFHKSEEELNSQFDKWMYVLKNLPRLTDRPAHLQERIFEQLFRLAEIARFNPADREAYNDSLKNYWDFTNVVDNAKEEGKEEGIEIGIEVGKEIGIEVGKEIGKAEGISETKIEMAKKMVAAGLSPETIAEISGLSVEDINRLVERLLP